MTRIRLFSNKLNGVPILTYYRHFLYTRTIMNLSALIYDEFGRSYFEVINPTEEDIAFLRDRNIFYQEIG